MASGARLLAWLVGINIFIGLIDGFFKQPLYEWSPWAFDAYDVFHFVLLPGVCALWVWRDGKMKLADVGLGRGNYTPGENVVLGVLLAIGLGLIYNLSVAVFAVLLRIWNLPSAADFQWGTALDKAGWRHGLAFYYAITAGVVEEVGFRGCLRWLLVGDGPGTRRSRRCYVWLSALVFGLTHWEQGAAYMLAATLYGFCMALVYLKLRDLWPLIGAHFLDDLVDFW